MMPVKTLGIAGVGAVVLLGAAWMGYSRVYAGPMADARADLVRFRNASRAYERDLETAGAVKARLREIGATTLGTSDEQVAHNFRSLLHEMAAMAGLSDITVTQNRTANETNPAMQARLAGIPRGESRTVDFWVMNGEIRGVGTLDQVARALSLSDRQSWVHRVPSFSVAPVNDERDRFEVRIAVATLILPDLGPGADAAATVTPLEPGAEAAWASIVSKNVFRLPDAAAPVAPPTTESVPDVPAGPPPHPYFAWRLAGVMEGGRGVRVVMVNDAAGQSVAVGVGERVLDAALVRASGEAAVFTIDGVEFEVRLGRTLAERGQVSDGPG